MSEDSRARSRRRDRFTWIDKRQAVERRDHLEVAVWIILAALTIVILDRQNSPRTFFFDEWDFILSRHSNSLSAWLAPHNGHLTLLPKLAYRIGFEMFGMNHYRPYRIMGLLAHILLATLVYRYVRVRQGAVIGLAAGALFLLLGSGWEVIYQPFTINFTASAIFGLLAWMSLDRRTSRRDVAASVCTGLALACGGLGIALILGTAARLAAGREWRRLVRVVAVPGAIYAVWYLTYGQSEGTFENVAKLPSYVIDEATSSIAGLAGRDNLWGRVALGALVVMAIRRVWTNRPARLAVIAPAVAMLSNWLLVAYARADLGMPESSRYVYIGAFFMILVFAELATFRPGSAAPIAVTIACALGIWGNWYPLHAGPVDMRIWTTYTRAELRAVEWASATVDPAFLADPVRLPTVPAGPYLDAVRDLGSAAATDGELATLADPFRREADRVSVQAGGATLTASAGCTGTTSMVETQTDASGATVVTVVIDAPGVATITSSREVVSIRMKRYGDSLRADPDFIVDVGTSAALTLAQDASPRQAWTIEARSAAGFSVCHEP